MSETDHDPADEDDENSADPPEASIPRNTLGDVIGLDEQKEKVRSVFLSRVRDGVFGGVRGQHFALIRGPVDANLGRFASGVCGTIHELGFEYYRIEPRQTVDPIDGIEAVIDDDPTVVHIAQLGELDHSDFNQFQELHQDVRDRAAPVVFVATLESVEGHGHRPHTRLEQKIRDDDITVTIPPLDTDRRQHILQQFLEQATSPEEEPPEISKSDWEKIMTPARDFGINALRKVASRTTALAAEGSPAYTRADIETALEQVRDETQYLSEDTTSTDVPDVTFDDIGGLDTVITRLKRKVVDPVEHAARYERMGLDATAGAVLYGPPGTGKTMLAKAVANTTDRYFVNIEGNEITDMFFGQSEKNLHQKFEEARENAPALIFIDELDSLAPERGAVNRSGATDRIVTQLLRELDGIESRGDLFVLGATNRLDAIDNAVLRPGRLGDERIRVDPPTTSAEQAAIVDVHFEQRPLAADVTPEWVATQLPTGISGAVIEKICDEAAAQAVYPVEDEPVITRADIEAAIEHVQLEDTAGRKAGPRGFQ